MRVWLEMSLNQLKGNDRLYKMLFINSYYILDRSLTNTFLVQFLLEVKAKSKFTFRTVHLSRVTLFKLLLLSCSCVLIFSQIINKLLLIYKISCYDFFVFTILLYLQNSLLLLLLLGKLFLSSSG